MQIFFFMEKNLLSEKSPFNNISNNLVQNLLQ